MRTPANSGSGRIPFQSTPSAWRETIRTQAPSLRRVISIHSLRMEGDNRRFRAIRDPTTFQSTPSAWRETHNSYVLFCAGNISIHSLRMEGDRKLTDAELEETIISIHSLRMEGDEYTRVVIPRSRHFNPLPPHGGRHFSHSSTHLPSEFQSTPSAWRETVKKSAILSEIS